MEEEHSRELQVEQSFKLFQEALDYQKHGNLLEAYQAYDVLYKMEVISNHYLEEEDYIRGLQNGGANTLVNELNYLSPNVKSLRYLIFRNRGFLYYSILKSGDSVIHSILSKESKEPKEVSPEEVKDKFKDMFYSVVEDFCICLVYQEGDEKLLELLFEIFVYLDLMRLARYTLEYSISGKTESDDLLGLLPTNTTIAKNYQLIQSRLYCSNLQSKLKKDFQHLKQQINEKLSFLDPVRLDYHNQIRKTESVHKVTITLPSDETAFSWGTIIDCMNQEIKKRQANDKVESIQRSKLKNSEPYLLSEEPLEGITFVLPTEYNNISDDCEIFEDAVDTLEEPIEIAIVESVPMEVEEVPPLENTETPVETIPEADVIDDSSNINSKSVTQRSSKRLAKVEYDSPEIEVKVQFFEETKRFFENLNLFLDLLHTDQEGLKLTDITKIYVPTEDDPAPDCYIKDFVDIIDDWTTPQYTGALFINEDPGSDGANSSDDEKKKLMEVLSNFGSKSKFNKADKYKEVPKINDFETKEAITSLLISLNGADLHYEDVKFNILKRLLGLIPIEDEDRITRKVCLVADTCWNPKLISKVKEWVMQFEGQALQKLNLNVVCQNQYLDNLALAVGFYEVLLDIYISVKTQINSLVSQSGKRGSQKLNKATFNNLSLELVKVNDKLNRWTSYIEDTVISISDDDIVDPQMHFRVTFRYKWSVVHKERLQNADNTENKFILLKLQELLDYIKSGEHDLEIYYPNYENIMEASVSTIKSQLTTTSVLAIFSRILYSKESNGESVQLLEKILIEDNSLTVSPGSEMVVSSEMIDPEALLSIKKFLDASPVDMKLSLWSILFLYYDGIKSSERFQFGFENALQFIFTYLKSTEYQLLPSSSRWSTLLRILGFYGENLNLYLSNLSLHEWKVATANKSKLMHTLIILVRFVELIYLFSLHEEAALITSLKVSIRTRSNKSYDKLKDIFVRTISIFLVYYHGYLSSISTDEPTNKSNQVVSDLVGLVHDQIGSRHLCDSSQGQFLKMAQEMLVLLKCSSDTDISQIISCRYHFSIAINNFTPKDHATSTKDTLEKSATLELSKFVLPLCFKKNPLINVPKHDTKALIDDFYEVIGDPDLESSDTLSRNNASLEFFLEYTSITPRFVRDAFHGLLTVDCEEPVLNCEIIQGGLYYLQALLIFTSYKVRKKNMQSRAVELEHIIMLLKNDLIHNTNRLETWFLLGQAYGYLVEDDLIWTSDKLTVADRKVGTANLQRKSLLCYLMATNGTLKAQSTDSINLIKPIVGKLMSSYAKEMYGACMEPMTMHAFKVQTNPTFIKKPSGAAFVTIALESLISLSLSFKVIQQSLHLAVKAKPNDWTNYYYLAKAQRKLDKDPHLILETLEVACRLAKEQSVSNEHIIEPHYATCSFIYKFVKADKLTLLEAKTLLEANPVIGLDVSEAPIESKHDVYKLVVEALKKVDAYDKKNWHHKPRYRLAKLLFEEMGDVEQALEVMSSLVSLKATSKTLVLIWKPEYERPGKHFFYTYQYARFYTVLLTSKLDMISLILMLPKLRRSNSVMVNLYAAWESLCSSICKMMRSLLDIGSSFSFSENFLQAVSYQVFMSTSKLIIEKMQKDGVPDVLKPHMCFLYAINDMKKFNNGFGPTSLIDDTIVGIYLKIYTHLSSSIEQESTKSFQDLIGGKPKKLAKRDIFPFATDILKHFRREIENTLKETPEIYNNFVKEVELRHKEESKIMLEKEAQRKVEEEVQRVEEETKRVEEETQRVDVETKLQADEDIKLQADEEENKSILERTMKEQEEETSKEETSKEEASKEEANPSEVEENTPNDEGNILILTVNGNTEENSNTRNMNEIKSEDNLSEQSEDILKHGSVRATGLRPVPKPSTAVSAKSILQELIENAKKRQLEESEVLETKKPKADCTEKSKTDDTVIPTTDDTKGSSTIYDILGKIDRANMAENAINAISDDDK